VFFDFFDRVIIAAKGGVFTFLSFPKKKGTKENCQRGGFCEGRLLPLSWAAKKEAQRNR